VPLVWMADGPAAPQRVRAIIISGLMALSAG
jgi:hypothetical protein